MAKTVVGLYRDFRTAEKVVRELVDNGFRREDISLIAQDASHGKPAGSETYGESADTGHGAATGAGTGAVLGGLAGLLVGLGALAIPGIGPILAAGPLATALAGAGIGAVAGGLIGALTEAGVPEDQAKAYAEGVRRGGTLVTVRADDNMANQARSIMDQYDPIDIHDQAGWSQQSGYAGTDYAATTPADMTSGTPATTNYASQGTGNRQWEDRGMTERDKAQRDLDAASRREGRKSEELSSEERNLEDRTYRERNLEDRDLTEGEFKEGERRIPIVEEDLRVGKREVQRGGVRVEKDVIEEPIEETHTVRDETVNVERRAVDRPATAADLDAFQEGTIEVTETDEELVVDKQARVTGEVVINKDAEEREQTVRDTVRRTEVHTEDLGTQGRTYQTSGQTTGYRDFGAYDADFRDHYGLVYGKRGRDYNFYEPAYRYGYELANSDRYQGRRWSEIEPEARREWERQNPNHPWNDFADAIRHGWERVTSGTSRDMGSGSQGTGYTGSEGYSSGMGSDRYSGTDNP